MTYFEDNEFKCSHDILPKVLQHKNVIWKRPHEIRDNPSFFGIKYADTVQDSNEFFRRRMEVIQGEHGGFFLAAVASLTKKKREFYEVVPPGQDLQNNYNGKFRFVFRRGGRKVEITIDDKLPTIKDRLVFAHDVNNSFWCPLLEKAYAKFLGGYQHLYNGTIVESFQHLISQNVKTIKLDTNSNADNIFNQLVEWERKNHLICCKSKDENSNNVHYGSGYTVTGTERRTEHSNNHSGNKVGYVRIRNPKGYLIPSEWTSIRMENGEGWLRIEEFIQRMMFIYHVEAENTINYEAGVVQIPIRLSRNPTEHTCFRG